ncbi:MAG TPA: SIS domain-containing protein [Hyphomonadaceae bacterium]|nr:SIS domain-containing protein [Hyphomonadaceae bacterium]
MNQAPPQTLMEMEARETPAVAARIVARQGERLKELAARLRAASPRFALAAGRGSSDAAALLAKYLFEMQLGLPTVSVAPSVHSIYGARLRLEAALLLAISQSGRSPDLVDFCHSATGKEILRVGLINDLASPLADAVDFPISLEAGLERSVAATKSCIAAMVEVLGLVAHWRQDRDLIAGFERSPLVLAAALLQDWSSGKGFLDGDGPVYVVGRGPGLAIAAEAALKLKETNGLHAEAVSAAEIRHGPLALAGPELRVIVLAQRDAALEGLLQTAADLGQRGSQVMLISAGAQTPTAIEPDAEPTLELLAMLLRFYLFANEAAIRRGRSPDHPPMLTKVTETR